MKRENLRLFSMVTLSILFSIFLIGCEQNNQSLPGRLLSESRSRFQIQFGEQTIHTCDKNECGDKTVKIVLKLNRISGEVWQLNSYSPNPGEDSFSWISTDKKEKETEVKGLSKKSKLRVGLHKENIRRKEIYTFLTKSPAAQRILKQSASLRMDKTKLDERALAKERQLQSLLPAALRRAPPNVIFADWKKRIQRLDASIKKYNSGEKAKK